MIKSLVKNFVLHIFRSLARFVLAKYKPRIIAITGSVGKTSTKDCIYSILRTKRSVWRSVKSYNHDFGVPLAILGLETGWRNPFKWLNNIFQASVLCVFNRPYPKLLVLEAGVGAPGDMQRLLSWLHPNVAVMTALGTIPVHVEFFNSPEELRYEKSLLVRSIAREGTVILNADDQEVLAMQKNTSATCITYGFSEQADVRASFETVHYENGIPVGTQFRIDYNGTSVPVTIIGALGKATISTVLAATAVALGEGLNLLEIVEAVKGYSPPPGRTRIIAGIKQTTIIDDTYNSSPAAVLNALNILPTVEVSGKKIAVLGDMMELGSYTQTEHENIGAYVVGKVDELFVVGQRAEFIALSAEKNGFATEHIYRFEDGLNCGKYLQDFIEPGDLILIKGSQSVRLERVVEEIMAEPERAKELLVRQDPEWKKR